MVRSHIRGSLSNYTFHLYLASVSVQWWKGCLMFGAHILTPLFTILLQSLSIVMEWLSHIRRSLSNRNFHYFVAESQCGDGKVAPHTQGSPSNSTFHVHLPPVSVVIERLSHIRRSHSPSRCRVSRVTERLSLIIGGSYLNYTSHVHLGCTELPTIMHQSLSTVKYIYKKTRVCCATL